MSYIGRKERRVGEKHEYVIAETPEGLDKYRHNTLSIPDVPPRALSKLLEFLNESDGDFEFETAKEARVSDGVGLADSWYYKTFSGEVDDVLESSNPFSRRYNVAGALEETGHVEHHTVKPKTELAIVLQMKSTKHSEGVVYFLKKG